MPTPNSILIIGAGIAGLTIVERIMRNQQSLAVTIVGATDERSQRVSFWRDRNRSAALALQGAQSWSAWSFNTPNLGFSLQGGKALEYVSLMLAHTKRISLTVCSKRASDISMTSSNQYRKRRKGSILKLHNGR